MKGEAMLSKEQNDAYRTFYQSARQNPTLDPKTTLLVHMATAMAIGCYPWVRNYLGVAKAEGITEKEIGAVQAIVMAVSAGRVNAQLREIREVDEEARKKEMSQITP